MIVPYEMKRWYNCHSIHLFGKYRTAGWHKSKYPNRKKGRVYERTVWSHWTENQSLRISESDFRRRCIQWHLRPDRRKRERNLSASVKIWGGCGVWIPHHLSLIHILLALLVARRGGIVEMEFAVDLLWEEEPFSEQVKGRFRKAVMNLKNTLRCV